MKKRVKKIFAVLLALAFVMSGISKPMTVSADETEYDLLLAYGGDKESSNDWGFAYNGASATNNSEGIQGTDAKIKVGETASVSMTLPSEAVYTWFMAPVLVAEGVSDLDVTMQVIMDGTDITSNIDFSIGKAWWYEATGDYADTQSIRLAGGYNEWGDKYITESPKFTTIEYKVTLNSLTVGGSGPVEMKDAEGKFPVFIAFGGDKEASGDWLNAYAGATATGNTEGITGTDAEIGIGDTVTVSMTLPAKAFYTWYLAPVVVAENIVEADFDVKVSVDGVDVTDSIDFGANADGEWWYEATGSYTDTQAVRLAGGYNEWGVKFIKEAPIFTTIEYTITCNTLKVGVQPTAPEVEIDLNGTYNAYIGVQTPLWYFRNSFDDAKYGLGTENFSQMSHSKDDGSIELVGGTFTDTVIEGNGTYTVSVQDVDFTPMMDDTGLFNLLFVSTDIPNSDKVTISDVILTIDGKEITKVAEPMLDKESKLVKKVLLANIWNSDIAELPYYAVPTKSIEITFTVSGFEYDKAVEVVETTPEPTAEATPEPTKEPETTPEPTEEAVETAVDSVEKDGINPVVIVVIVLVVAAVAGAGVMVMKKKNNK